MSEGEQQAQERRQVGDTPLLITEDELDAMHRRSVRGGTLSGRVRAYIMQKTSGLPILQEHLLIVLDAVTRASRSWICWAVVAVLVVLTVQNALVQMSVEREHMRRPIAFKRSMGGGDDYSFDLEQDIGDAYREWKLLQEQFPNKFGNFSKAGPAEIPSHYVRRPLPRW
ncbi:putative transmembrane protein [Gregarina niphandrodes]|uniref:Transmembrane protein n=1 Tax=Gregarina niphandrodes TaxID=110365 RepID=A0A023B8M0_GRENI|nr:putative transmembrane protein [Gregarina niphandrodes]EZG69129.1 putative transmembrane protein [Gregarina niphandrodes]|eukprot:XP_011134478.1 putative transmembrane protein [Gregarina niphandrodes]